MVEGAAGLPCRAGNAAATSPTAPRLTTWFSGIPATEALRALTKRPLLICVADSFVNGSDVAAAAVAAVSAAAVAAAAAVFVGLAATDEAGGAALFEAAAVGEPPPAGAGLMLPPPLLPTPVAAVAADPAADAVVADPAVDAAAAAAARAVVLARVAAGADDRLPASSGSTACGGWSKEERGTQGGVRAAARGAAEDGVKVGPGKLPRGRARTAPQDRGKRNRITLFCNPVHIQRTSSVGDKLE